MAGELAVLGGSAAVVALMVGVAWLLGFRATARIERETLERLLALNEPGVRLAGAVIGADGRAALARLDNGKLMVARVMGGDVSARFYPQPAMSLRLTQRQLHAAFADLGFPSLNMKLDADAPPWLAEMAGGAGGQA